MNNQYPLDERLTHGYAYDASNATKEPAIRKFKDGNNVTRYLGLGMAGKESYDVQFWHGTGYIVDNSSELRQKIQQAAEEQVQMNNALGIHPGNTAIIVVPEHMLVTPAPGVRVVFVPAEQTQHIPINL